MENKEVKPNYYSIIPSTVRYDKSLRANEKLLYGEITALADQTGECWASNSYFADLYEVTPQAISRWIKNLESKGYITIEYLYSDDKKSIKKRIIKEVSTNIDRGINKKLRGYQQKVKENNTSIIYKKERKKKKSNTTYDEILNELIEDDGVKSVFKEFIKMRKLIKKPLTDYALKRIINKLHKLSASTEIQIEILNQSITNSWQDIYELKNMKDNPTNEVQTLSSDYYEVLE